MSKKNDIQKKQLPELKATQYEMIHTEQIPLASPQEIYFMNPNLLADTIPPVQIVAMNGINALIKN